MALWLAGLILLAILVVSLGLLVWMAEGWLAEFRRGRELGRWEAGMLERLAAPGTEESRLDDLRRLHAIVDARMRLLNGRAPGLHASLEHALYQCATQPQAVRQKVTGGGVPSIESIKVLIDRLDRQSDQASPATKPAETVPAGDSSAPEPESTLELEPSAGNEGMVWKGSRLATENPLIAALIATVLGGLILAWIGIGESGSSTPSDGASDDTKSRIVEQLTLHQDLVNVDLEGADLRGKYLRRKNMREANLFEAKLQKADLAGATLVEANMRKARLTETIFEGARLWEARLEEAEGNSPYFEHAKAARAKFGDAKMPGGSFVGAHLPHAYMVEAEFPRAFFQEADLRGVEAGGVKMPNARLEAAQLNDADMAGADLHGAQLYEADARSVDFESADLRGANLCRADLRGATLSAAQLEGARFDPRTRWPRNFDFEAHGVIKGGC